MRTVGKDRVAHGIAISRAEIAHKSGQQRKQKVRSGSLVRAPKARATEFPQKALPVADRQQVEYQQAIAALHRVNEELSTRIVELRQKQDNLARSNAELREQVKELKEQGSFFKHLFSSSIPTQSSQRNMTNHDVLARVRL